MDQDCRIWLSGENTGRSRSASRALSMAQHGAAHREFAPGEGVDAFAVARRGRVFRGRDVMMVTLVMLRR